MPAQFVNKDFKDLILASLIWFHGGINDTNVYGKLFEEMVYNALAGSGQRDVLWDCGENKQGCDVISDGVRISCKSGTFLRRSFQLGAIKEYVKLSSYRLGKHKSITDKEAFIQTRHEDIILGLANRHANKSKNHRYTMHTINRDAIDIESINWSKHMTRTGRSNWRGMSKRGVVAEIVESMSSQLWLYVPMDLVQVHFDVTVFSENQTMYTDNLKNEMVWIEVK